MAVAKGSLNLQPLCCCSVGVKPGIGREAGLRPTWGQGYQGLGSLGGMKVGGLVRREGD